MFDVESVLEEAPESTEQLDFDRIQDIEMMGGTTSGYVWVHLGTDSYFPPEVKVRLVR